MSDPFADSKPPQPRTERINALIELRQYRLAEEECRAMLSEDANNAEILRLLAFALYKQGRRIDALNGIDEALAANPSEYRAHYLRALVLATPGKNSGTINLAGASNSAEMALKLAPREPNCFGLLAWLQNSRNYYALAIEAASQGLAINPEHENCLLQIVQALQSQGRWQESEKYVRMLLTVNPDLPAAHWTGGKIAMAKGKLEVAKKLYQGASRLDPLNEVYHADYASARLAQVPGGMVVRKIKEGLKKYRLTAIAMIAGLAGLLCFVCASSIGDTFTWIIVLSFWGYLAWKIYWKCISVLLAIKDPLYRFCHTERQRKKMVMVFGMVHFIAALIVFVAGTSTQDYLSPPRFFLCLCMPIIASMPVWLISKIRPQKIKYTIFSTTILLVVMSLLVAGVNFGGMLNEASPRLAATMFVLACFLWVIGASINNAVAISLLIRS